MHDAEPWGVTPSETRSSPPPAAGGHEQPGLRPPQVRTASRRKLWSRYSRWMTSAISSVVAKRS